MSAACEEDPPAARPAAPAHQPGNAAAAAATARRASARVPGRHVRDDVAGERVGVVERPAAAVDPLAADEVPQLPHFGLNARHLALLFRS